MKVLLEEFPTLLDEADVRNLMNRDYCEKTLGIRIGGFPLLRRMESGRAGSPTDHQARYYGRLYGGRFYVCSQWWKDDHLLNAKSLLAFVTGLIEKRQGHPGIQALTAHKNALSEYIRR